MNEFLYRLFIGGVFICIIACNRTEPIKTSLKLQFPPAPKTSGAVHVMSNTASTGFTGNYPINCYVAMVSGPEAEMQNNLCEKKNDSAVAPRKVGVWAGGISDGQTVSLDVPIGKDRVVMIGGFYAPSGSCVDLKKDNSGAGLSPLYLLGEVNQVNLSGGGTVEIPVPMTFDANVWFDSCHGSDFNISIPTPIETCPGSPSCATTLTIVSATYGKNCGQLGNRTDWLSAICNGQATCAACPLDVGDPAPGCAKDYVIDYTCGATTKSYYANPEAGFDQHAISCP